MTRTHANRTRRTLPDLWRRTPVRRGIQLGTLGALLLAALTPVSSAQAAPERVLQSVDVRLGSDGSITSIDSNAIRRSGEDETTTDQQSFDPTEAARDLPVRVLTSYRLGERSGTDLRDIEGEEGRVVIDVTVQNTTVRPELLTYDTGTGATARDYALVGTPMTVVGSSVIPTDDLSRLVLTNDADPTEITSGVVSPRPDGGTQVQWAAMLAPPRLAPSATFRLVQQTADFQVPTFDFSVQPGLRTDTSITRLLQSAFSESDNSTVDLQTSTISLIGNVNTSLTDAGSILGDIRSSLNGSADDLGQRTVAELRSGRARVEENITATVGQLGDLDDRIGNELETNADQVLTTLGSTIDRVTTQLGDPGASRPQLGFDGECQSRIPDRGPGQNADVLSQVRLIGAQLDALSRATGSCTEELKTGLRQTIGQRGEDCDAESTTALCTLQQAADELEDGKAGLVAFGQQLKNLADPNESIAALRAQIDVLTANLVGLQVTANSLGTGSYGRQRLVNVRNQLVSIDDALDKVSLGRITAGYDAIQRIAGDQLRGGFVPEVIPNRLLDGASTEDALARAEALRRSLPECDATDLDCQYSRYLADQLVTDLEDVKGAWQEVERNTDVSAAVKAFDQSKAGVSTAVNAIRDQINVEIAEIDRDLSDSDGFNQTVLDLRDQLNALYGVNPVRPCDPADAGSDEESDEDDESDENDDSDEEPVRGPFNDLIDAFTTVSCNTAALQAAVDGKIGEFAGLLSEQQGDLMESQEKTGEARAEAERRVEAVTDRIQGEVEGRSRELVDVVTASVRAQRADLQQAQTSAVRGLEVLARTAVGRISGQVQRSNRDLAATSTALQRDLTSILLDIGSRDGQGSGLLGILDNSARRTGLSNDELAQVSRSTGAFRSVRGQQLADLRLQQEQTDSALRDLADNPSFGLDVPEGSTVETVFTFRLGAS